MEYGKGLDSAEDIVKSGIDVYLDEGSFHANYLKTSANEWERKIGNAAKYFNGWDEQKELMVRLAKDGDVVMWGGNFEWLRNSDKKYADLPKVHKSKESKKGWVAWAIQKMSPWQEALDLHQLHMKEVPLELEIKDYACFVSGS